MYESLHSCLEAQGMRDLGLTNKLQVRATQRKRQAHNCSHLRT